MYFAPGQTVDDLRYDDSSAAVMSYIVLPGTTTASVSLQLSAITWS